MRRLFYDEGGWTRMWVIAAGIIIGILGFAGVAVYAGVQVDEATCRQVASKTGNPTKYALNSGCWIKADGRWVPYDKWIVNTGK